MPIAVTTHPNIVLRQSTDLVEDRLLANKLALLAHELLCLLLGAAQVGALFLNDFQLVHFLAAFLVERVHLFAGLLSDRPAKCQNHRTHTIPPTQEHVDPAAGRKARTRMHIRPRFVR
jgi:hypothetical protein